MSDRAEEQLLRNPDIAPTSEIIAEALGAANIVYVKFIDELKEHAIQLEWRYYNDGKSWLGKGLYKSFGARGGQKEVTSFWLSIWDGFFKVTIYMPEKARADAFMLPLDDEIREMIEHASPMGKLKFFPLIFEVRSEELFGAIYTLIDFRKTIK